MSHRNAPLSETGRLRLARCVVDDGWPLRRAAERFQVSATTAARWAGRYRSWRGRHGRRVLATAPHPRRTPTRTERRIIKVRVIRRWGPARIAYLLGLHPSTVHRVLPRYRLAHLGWLDRATGRVIRRYESPIRRARACRRQKAGQDPRRRWVAPHGRQLGQRKRTADAAARNTRNSNPAAGYHFLHNAVETLPLAYPSCCPTNAGDCRSVLGRAHAWFVERHHRQRVMTDNGSCYRSRAFRARSATSNTAAPAPTGPRPTARSNASTAPWPTNGPTPGSTAATPNAATITQPGSTPTITTAATPQSAANRPPAAYH